MKRDSVEFEAVKREVLALPVVKKNVPLAPGSTPSASGPPAAPSGNLIAYQGTSYTLNYPDNWKKYGDGKDVSFAPDRGIVQANTTQGALAYGMEISVTSYQGDANAADALETATQQFITGLQKTNPNLRVTRESQRVHLNGQPGLSTYLSNDSPVGGQETDWIITVLRPEGLLSFVCVSPQKDFSNYEKTYSKILDSVRFAQ